MPLVLSETCQRQQRATELLQTERNYARMLRSLLDNVVVPLEEQNGFGKSGLISPIDLDIVFGRLPIICRIHEQIVSELTAVMEHWSTDAEIGIIYSKCMNEISHVYLSYVNSYDDSRRFLQDSLKQKTRLQTFIGRCLSLPEFGRQSLSDILIRPIQRLPTVLLLLKDLQKHTNEASPDHVGLANAVMALDNVLKMINTGRRASGMQLAGCRSFGQIVPNGQSSFNLALAVTASPTPSRKNTSKQCSVDGTHSRPDATSLKAWEKARKLAVRTSTRVSKVFTFGARTSSGSGLKRTVSTVSVSVNPPTTKNPKNVPTPDNIPEPDENLYI